VTTAGPSGSPGRLVPLEALRGGAAIIVVLHHFVLAFLPRYIGLTPGVDPAVDLIGSPLFVFLNGTGMVVIFFVLSGYVLAQRGLRANPVRSLLDAAIKRWFRLTPMILASVLLSWALFHWHLYAFEAAARDSHSDWLLHFSYSELTQADTPSLAFAVSQGLWGCLVRGESSLDSSLWTMNVEFVGSFIVFALALLLQPGWRRGLPVLLVGAGCWLLLRRPWLFPFIAGFGACLLPVRTWRLSAWTTGALTLLGLYLAGFAIPTFGATPGRPAGAYAWMGGIGSRFATDPRGAQIALVCGAGALVLLLVCVSDNCLSRRLTGRVARAIGAASFPLYAVHVLIIDSAASAVYARLGGSRVGLAGAAVALVVTLVPLVWVLARFDRWWLAVLRRFGWDRSHRPHRGIMPVP
jgi:peptidoglycan/LPS O-acetylase OafA/YrhL